MFKTAATAVSAAALVAILVSGAAEAASASGTVRLTGTVAVSCTVAVSDLGASLDLINGESDTTVANVEENCNNATGYTVTLSSANAGVLVGDGSGSPTASYEVSYDGQSAALSSDMTVSRSSAQFSKSVALGVTIAADAEAIAGNYADTITIEIAAK